MNNSRVTYTTIGRTVMATIEDCEFDALEVFTTKYLAHTTSALSLVPNAHDERFIMPHRFTAKAECSIEDKFDYETGKRIALDRLSEKYTKSLNKHLGNILCTMDEALDNLEAYLTGKTF